MKLHEFVEMLDELITVDTDEGVIEETSITDNKITVTLYDKTKLIVTVEQA